MSNQKQNYDLYQNTFNKVHASDELVRKVKLMTKENSKTKIYALKKVLCIAAAAVFLFVASNVVAFAATGETWVEMITMKVTYNGEKKDIDIIKTTDEDGNTRYVWHDELKDKNGEVYTYEFDLGSDINAIQNIEIVQFMPQLVEKDGRIYVTEPLYKVNQDITEDFADGEAKVELTMGDEETHILTITGTVENPSFDVD